MKVGDLVKVVGVPPDTHNREDMLTKTLFERCLGKCFPVTDLESVEGLPYPVVRLEVGEVFGVEHDAVLDDLGEPGAEIALGQGGRGRRVDEHEPWLVEGPDQVLRGGVIDGPVVQGPCEEAGRGVFDAGDVCILDASDGLPIGIVEIGIA